MISKLSVMRGGAAIAMMTASLIFFCFPATARETGEGHELRLGLGGMPIGLFLAQGFAFAKYEEIDITPAGLSRSDRYHDYSDGGKSVGTLTAEYFWNFNERNAIGVGLGFDYLFGRLYDGYDGKSKGMLGAYGLSVWPEYRRTWNPGKAVKLYSSLAAGIGCFHHVKTNFKRYYNPGTGEYSDEEKWSYIPVVQVNPIGLSWGGDHLYGFAELSLGSLVFGGRMGVGYKF